MIGVLIRPGNVDTEIDTHRMKMQGEIGAIYLQDTEDFRTPQSQKLGRAKRDSPLEPPERAQPC